MCSEIITFINGSLVQLSALGQRIYLIKLSANNILKTISELDNIAKEKKFTKIIAKIPSKSKDIFLENGYKIEAQIPGFYNNEEDVYFMSKFLAKEREICNDSVIIKDVLTKSFEKAVDFQKYDLKSGFRYEKIKESEVESLIELYKEVFLTYPFPIFDTSYILETMLTNNEYFGIWENEKLVATATAEKDISAQNAEVTDFAVLPSYRGNNFSVYLIQEIEKILKTQNIKTAYTISRAGLYGMNISFAKMEYKFVGTLINNTHINNKLESMHIWYKKI